MAPLDFERAVAKSVWDGQIPIMFALHPSEAGVITAPEPRFILASRMSYLPLVLPRDTFTRTTIASAVAAAASANLVGGRTSSPPISNPAPSINNNNNNNTNSIGISEMSGDGTKEEEMDVWFSYQDQPLRWHFPIGVLFDMHKLSQKDLPWPIHVHFKSFPSEKILRCPFYFSGLPGYTPPSAASESPSCQGPLEYYMHMIKEADYIRNGNSNKVMNLRKTDQTQLWDSLVQLNFDKFWEVNAKLINSEVSLQGKNYPKNIPYKIYIPDEPPCQEPCAPTDKNGKEVTLGELLHQVLSGITPTGDAENPYLLPAGIQIVVHGISPPLSTPLWWLAQHFSHADSFLHIVLVVHRSSE